MTYISEARRSDKALQNLEQNTRLARAASLVVEIKNDELQDFLAILQELREARKVLGFYAGHELYVTRHGLHDKTGYGSKEIDLDNGARARAFLEKIGEGE